MITNKNEESLLEAFLTGIAMVVTVMSVLAIIILLYVGAK